MEKLTMSVKELSQAIGLSIPGAYELASREDFPCIQVGRRKVIPIDAFKRWMDEQTSRQQRAVKGGI